MASKSDHRSATGTRCLNLDTANKLIDATTRRIKVRRKGGLGRKKDFDIQARMAELDISCGDIGRSLNEPRTHALYDLMRHTRRGIIIRIRRPSIVVDRGVDLRAALQPHEVLHAAMCVFVDTRGGDAQLHGGHIQKND